MCIGKLITSVKINLLLIYYNKLILDYQFSINKYYDHSSFDTETTGLPQFRVPPNSTNILTWPYIVQLSYILYDTDKIKL